MYATIKTAMASSCDVDEVFRLFTIPAGDFFKSYLIVDIRDKKYFEKGHINQAFCVRLAANGQALLDYSKAEYHAKWSQASYAFCIGVHARSHAHAVC